MKITQTQIKDLAIQIAEEVADQLDDIFPNVAGDILSDNSIEIYDEDGVADKISDLAFKHLAKILTAKTK